MDEQKNNNDINLLAKEYAEQAVREARKLRGENGRNALTKLMILFSLAVLAFAVFIFATIAWFTMNREVGTGGMSMASQNGKFNIFVEGVTNGHNSYIEKIVGGPALTDGRPISVNSSLVGSKNGFLSIYGEQTDGIFWRLASNTGSASDSLIEPGSQGELVFYIQPNDGGDISVDIKLELIGYYLRTDEDDNEYLIEVSSESTANERAAYNYIRGHMLFFTERSDTANAKGEYSYSGLLNGSNPDDLAINFKWEQEDVTKGELYEVKLYWIWPNTVGQILLDDDDPLISGRTVAIDSTARAGLVDYLKIQKNNIFSSPEPITDAMIDAPSDFFTELSKSFNNADQMIGTYINFYMLRLTAE